MFYSDVFDLDYETVGKMSSYMKTIADWQEEPFKKGVVDYMDYGRVRACCCETSGKKWKKLVF